jgi:hypothetical protein
MDFLLWASTGKTIMADHLIPCTIEGYRLRTLTPAQLLQVDDHIARCGMCRRILREAEPLQAAFEALRAITTQPPQW